MFRGAYAGGLTGSENRQQVALCCAWNTSPRRAVLFASDVRWHPASAESITTHQGHIDTCQDFVKASAGRCILGHRASFSPLSMLEPWTRARGRQRGSGATWRIRKHHIARLLSTHEREDSVFASCHVSNCKWAATAQRRGRGPTISVSKTVIAGRRQTRPRWRCRVGRRRIGPLSKQTPATLQRLSRTERRQSHDRKGVGVHRLEHPGRHLLKAMLYGIMQIQ